MVQRAEKEGLLASDSEVDRFNEYKAPYTKEELEKEFEKQQNDRGRIQSGIAP